jgi:hypothetical protein
MFSYKVFIRLTPPPPPFKITKPYVHLSSARLSLIFGTGQKHGAPTWWDARGTVGAQDILLMPRDNAKLLSVCINLAEMQPATRFTELNGNTLMFC